MFERGTPLGETTQGHGSERALSFEVRRFVEGARETVRGRCGSVGGAVVSENAAGDAVVPRLVVEGRQKLRPS